jgi:hypothetical protein
MSTVFTHSLFVIQWFHYPLSPCSRYGRLSQPVGLGGSYIVLGRPDTWDKTHWPHYILPRGESATLLWRYAPDNLHTPCSERLVCRYDGIALSLRSRSIGQRQVLLLRVALTLVPFVPRSTLLPYAWFVGIQLYTSVD